MTARPNTCPAFPATAFFWETPGSPDFKGIVDLVSAIGQIVRWLLPGAKRFFAFVKDFLASRRRSNPTIESHSEEVARPTEGEAFFLRGRRFFGLGLHWGGNRIALEPGSIISPGCANSMPPNVRRLRCKYAPLIDENHVLTERIVFNSPSAAAQFVTGCATNGRLRWLDSKGRPLSERAFAH